jgi:photosystem II stability/assembly factor-like uncharacterized protein
MIAAAASYDYIYASYNGGVTWSALTGAGSRDWRAVAASYDFSKMAAGFNGGYIFVTSDSGATWTAMTGAGS